ncbi:MAG: hypothetical protein VB933_10150 [Pseudomonadales bacterium]
MKFVGTMAHKQKNGVLFCGRSDRSGHGWGQLENEDVGSSTALMASI